ncbi:MAG: phosphatase PAP2 family protein, partial [Myxococcales bacterium]|nr:phosphatase PAP2 family protein [Myxococcales bacterium]
TETALRATGTGTGTGNATAIDAATATDTDTATATDTATDTATAPATDTSARWRPSFRRLGFGHAIAGGVAAAAGIVMRLTWDAPDDARWPGAGVIDRGFADALRSHGRRRDRLEAFSDVLLYSAMAYPFVEAFAVGLGDREAWPTAFQLSMVSALAVTLNLFVTQTFKLALARARPYVSTCDGADPHPSCGASDSYQSMPSGHSSSTFATAGLVCASQRALPIYGRDGGPIACASLLAVATTTAALRVAADKHWLSDVLVGGTLGFAIGYLLPTLSLFRNTRHRGDATAWNVVPWASSHGAGLVAGGTLGSRALRGAR